MFRFLQKLNLWNSLRNDFVFISSLMTILPHFHEKTLPHQLCTYTTKCIALENRPRKCRRLPPRLYAPVTPPKADDRSQCSPTSQSHRRCYAPNRCHALTQRRSSDFSIKKDSQHSPRPRYVFSPFKLVFIFSHGVI